MGARVSVARLAVATADVDRLALLKYVCACTSS
jgi:hypothetical protein